MFVILERKHGCKFIGRNPIQKHCQKIALIAFLAIFLHKMARGSHFGCSKINFDHIFLIPDQYTTLLLQSFHNDHFGCLKITFDRISRHFRSKVSFFYKYFSQNGCRRPFWMAENHFRSHFSPFQINTQLIWAKIDKDLLLW